MSREPISYELFVEIWQNSECLADVAKAIDRSRTTVEEIAGKLRKKGVELKSMRTTPMRKEVIDEALVARLNAKIRGAG